jgi:hypothetical protein
MEDKIFMLLDWNYMGYREKIHSNRIRPILLARMFSKITAKYIWRIYNISKK